jgi:hypothetical protein
MFPLLPPDHQLTLDPERSGLIRKRFEMVASGKYSTTDAVLRQLNALGLTTLKGDPVSKQTFQRILNNELYAGWLKSGDRARIRMQSRSVEPPCYGPPASNLSSR